MIENIDISGSNYKVEERSASSIAIFHARTARISLQR